ncbi:MAG: ABC transporter substrate-binding protein [Cyanobacteria bacterium P01_H01_bin.15]
MKPNVLLSSLFASLLLLGAGCASNAPKDAESSSAEPQELVKVDVCYSGDSGTQVVVWYAFEEGLFEKHGLDVNLVSVPGGSTAATTLVSGEMDFCQIAGSAVVNAVVAGEDLVIIGGFFNTHITSLMVLPEIETEEDLVGKAVAISKPGSASDYQIRVVLQEMGLQPDDDVAVLAVGGQGARLAAMESKQVVGTVISPPNTVIARDRGYRELVKLSDWNLPYQHTGVVTTRSYLADNPAAGEAFMKATIEAIAKLKNDPEGGKEVMAKYMLLDTEEDAKALEEAYSYFVQETVSQPPYPTLEGISPLLSELEKDNPTAADFTPEDVVDVSVVTVIEESGFVEEVIQP